LHTVAAEEDTHTAQEITVTQVQWVREQEILTVEAQAEAEELAEIGSTEQQAEAEALAEQVALEEIQHLATELDHQAMLVDLVGDQEHLVVLQDQITAGHHGLVSEDLAEKECTDSQAVVAVAEELVAEVRVAEELVDHRLLITQAEQVEMEQAQVAEEIITQVVMVQREETA